MKQIYLFFDSVPLSANQVLRMSPMKRNRYNHGWYSAVNDIVEKKGLRPKEPFECFHLKFTRHNWRLLDWDNAVSSLKCICDGAIKAGLIKDDCYKSTCGPWDVTQVFRPKKLGQLLEVWITPN